MIFRDTDIEGVRLVELEPHTDDRGFFARSFCRDEFAAAGIDFTIVQTNISRNTGRGTLRGMHYQANPAPEPKLVRCSAGRIFDVAVDLRPASPSFCQWTGFELDASVGTGLYVPVGCAHGFLTLSDNAEITYLMGAPYAPDLTRGVRWNDAAFAINWPFEPMHMSDKDSAYPDFDPGASKDPLS